MPQSTVTTLYNKSAKMIAVLSLQSASRDPQRSPMQWTGDMNAGFNNKTNTTWLPVHPDYRSVNVEVKNSFYTFQLSRNISYMFILKHVSPSRSRRKTKVLF